MRSRLEPGIRAPDFTLPGTDGTPKRLYGHLGGTPSVLILWRTDAEATVSDFCTALRQSARALVECHIIVGEGSCTGMSANTLILCDAGETIARAYGMGENDDAVAYLLDSNLRVVVSLDIRDTEITLSGLLTTLESTQPPARREIRSQAPVLLIDRVLDSDFCGRLVETWGTGGNAATGVEKSDAGRRQDSIEEDKKRRRDHVVEDRDLLEQLTSTLGRRIIPELQKSFSYRATRFEGFKIVAYTAADAGFFKAHRDNLSPATAHRRFALTVNLNSDYEGGELVFPEYGIDLYRPAPGAAVVFSCSHLHEVTPVTRGTRFALLSFMFGEVDRSREAG